MTEFSASEPQHFRFCAPPALSVLRDVVANLVWFLTRRSEVFIGIDNVNAVCGLVVRLLGRARRVVFYAVDYTPSRFGSRPLNWLYQLADGFAARHADRVWNISEAIAEVHAARGTPADKNLVVPFGVQLDLIRPAAARDRHAVVILSTLFESKGIQLAIGAMRRVIAVIPDASLHIIGSGPYESELRRLVSELGLDRVVTFHGLLPYEQLYRVMSECGVGLAPYVEAQGSYSYFADPGKPKEYLACGLPVIITDVPRIARRIANEPMGLCIRYDEDELVSAIVRLSADAAFYDTCVTNARAFSATLSWNEIYARAIADLEGSGASAS